jgi:hypothetical protein
MVADSTRDVALGVIGLMAKPALPILIYSLCKGGSRNSRFYMEEIREIVSTNYCMVTQEK